MRSLPFKDFYAVYTAILKGMQSWDLTKERDPHLKAMQIAMAVEDIVGKEKPDA